jgi:hypothetical protein
MLKISYRAGKMRGFAIALGAAFSIAGALVVPACSSDSTGAADDAGIVDVAFPQACTTPIRISAGDPGTNTFSGGACTSALASVACTYQAPCIFTDITIYTCTCDGTSWSCAITGDVEGGTCDAGFTDAADANEEADASEASDASAFDASDDAADF